MSTKKKRRQKYSVIGSFDKELQMYIAAENWKSAIRCNHSRLMYLRLQQTRPDLYKELEREEAEGVRLLDKDP